MKYNNERTGTFSSSNIHKLVKKGTEKNIFSVAGLTYINEVFNERLTLRPSSVEMQHRQTTWGKLCEYYLFQKLDLKYVDKHDERIFHKTMECWSGAPDLISTNTVADIKCPFSPNVFANKIRSHGNIEMYKKMFPEDYWQLVSNAILMESHGNVISHGESIVFCPTKTELSNIRSFVETLGKSNTPEIMAFEIELQKKVQWFMLYSDDEQLPYISDDSILKPINTFSFVIPKEDKDFLTNRILLAEKEICKLKSENQIYTNAL